MRIPFIKMHGLGNDFVVLDAREGALPPIGTEAASRLADRHRGIGCDQLIILRPSEGADFAVEIRNSDGSEAEACGNAFRAIGLLHGTAARVETTGGTISIDPVAEGISVEMAAPRFDWQAIPLAFAMDTASMPIAWEDLQNPAAVNVGNPHVVFFVDDTDAIDLARIGPQIENDPLFPQKVNVNVATIEDGDRVRLRVWERGAGLTQACGTGACASAVAAIRRGLVGSQVTVALPGGELGVRWREGEPLVMTGPATEAFRGAFDAASYGIEAI